MAGKKPIENIEYVMARQQIKQRIQAIIKNATKLSHSSRYKSMCAEFLNCIEPETVPGINPLPLIAGPNNRCRVRSKYECLLFKISYLIQHFHKLTPTNSLTLTMIKGQVQSFEWLLKKGLNGYEIRGSKFPGYFLQEK